MSIMEDRGRAALDADMSRKPGTWDEIHWLPRMTVDILTLLFRLPTFVAGLVGINRVNDIAQVEKLPQWFILTRGQDVYVVNTEGYNYCRYIVRL